MSELLSIIVLAFFAGMGFQVGHWLTGVALQLIDEHLQRRTIT